MIRNRFAAIGAALLACLGTTAGAAFLAAPSINNALQINEYNGNTGFSSTAGKTLVGGYTFTTGDLWFVGSPTQSHIATISDGGASKTPSHTTACLNLNIYNGSVYQLADPVLGAMSQDTGAGTPESWFPDFCDKLITDGKATRVILATPAIGGGYVTDMTPVGVYWHRFRAAMIYALKVYNVPSNKMYVLVQQGQADTNSANPYWNPGSPGFTTQAQWQAQYQLFVQSTQALGFTGKFFVARDICPYFSGKSCSDGSVYSNSVNIDAAQVAVVDSVTTFAGPDLTNTMTTGQFGAGKLHYNSTGAPFVGTAWATAVEPNL